MNEQNDIDVKEAKSLSLMQIGTPHGGLIPQNFEALWRLANIMAKSGMMPDGLKTVEAVFVAVQMGLEVGLSPMQAVQNIAVINGRPSLWGDAGLALVEASGLLEDFKESLIEEDAKNLKAICWAKRKGRPTPIERSFSWNDAKQAELATKKGTWQQYPKRMIQMRARWWVLRDGFADVLKGLKAAEEMIDLSFQANGSYAAAAASVAQKTSHRTEELKERINKLSEPKQEPEPAELPAKDQSDMVINNHSEISKFIRLKRKGFEEYCQQLEEKTYYYSWNDDTRGEFIDKCDKLQIYPDFLQQKPPKEEDSFKPGLVFCSRCGNEYKGGELRETFEGKKEQICHVCIEEEKLDAQSGMPEIPIPSWESINNKNPVTPRKDVSDPITEARRLAFLSTTIHMKTLEALGWSQYEFSQIDENLAKDYLEKFQEMK